MALALIGVSPAAQADERTRWYHGESVWSYCDEDEGLSDDACKYAASRIHYDTGGYIFGIHAEGGTGCNNPNIHQWAVAGEDPEVDPDAEAAWLKNYSIDPPYVYWKRERTFFQDNCDILDGSRHTFVTNQSVRLQDDIRAVVHYYHRDDVESDHWFATEIHVRV